MKIFVHLLLISFLSSTAFSQLFPNPTTLSTGQGTPGNNDPIWECSQWYTNQPNDVSSATFTPALINNNCAPGSWVDPGALTPPMNNGNWITGQDANCAQNSTAGYRFFRLTLDLPADCNGFSVTQVGNYTLDFIGYVDNAITDVFLNGNSLGISGGSYSAGSQLSFSIQGPWVAGTNYIDVLVYNTSNPSNPTNPNPYGLLLVADANSANGNDTDGDGISDLFDECPCEDGNNPVGCIDHDFTCDVQMIRDAFSNAGCIELQGCWDDCSMYFLNPQYLSGSAAQSFAQTLGANLISIQSAEENACILSDLNRLGYGSGDVIWIGFNDEAVEGQFQWYDGSQVVYTNWAPGEPNNSGGNENCTQIYPGGNYPGTWNDLKCNGYNSLSVIEVNLCPITTVTAPITMCQETDTTIGVIQTILGSAPYTYSWDDGSTQLTQSVSPLDSTMYIVTTKDRYKCQVKDTVFVNVNKLPTAKFSDNAGCQTDFEVEFTNESNVDGNEPLTYSWNFGSGTANEENPTYTFNSFGSYSVTLSVSTANNCSDEVTQMISINPQPTADFTFDADCSLNPEITFTNTSSSPDNSVLSSQWDFGNGMTSTEDNPVVTLPQPTGNTITLIVSTSSNCYDTLVRVVDANVLPQPNFDYTPNCIDEPINFTNTSSIANGTPLEFEWFFSNGQTSTATNPSTSFSSSGGHSVILIAKSNNGCADTIVKDVTVYPFPNLPIITSNSPVECPGNDFIFEGNAVSGASYFWSGPLGFESNNRENTLIASEENIGDYSLYITVNGCPSDVAFVTLSIEGKTIPLVEDFPNIITPNGDGMNDFIDMNEYFSSCLPFKIEIFNRWGNLVFTQEAEGAVFDGKDQQSGANLSDGIYFYKLTYGEEVRHGYITIAR